MRLEVGKYYRARSGSKFGPMKPARSDGYDFYGSDGGIDRVFQKNGKHGGSYIKPDPNLDLIAEWTDGPVFTVGAKVRRIAYPHPFVPIGYEATVTAINGGNLFYVDADGDPMNSSVEYWELVSEAPTGPVRTVTRREVVPGVWSGVTIEVIKDQGPCVAMPYRVRTADELRAAAAVLLELAGALDE